MKRHAAGISIEELHQMDRAQRAALPKPQPCHACGHAYIGCACPTCKEERPAYTAMKNITRRS